MWTRDSVSAGKRGCAPGTGPHCGFELLESRTLLSASVTQVTPASLSHVSGDLVEQYQQYAAFTHTKAAKHGAAFKPTLSPSIATKGGKVGIIVRPAAGFYSQVLRQLRGLGVKISSTNTQYTDITGFTPVSALAKIGKIKGIGSVTPLVKPTVHTAGIVPNQADQAMQVQLARNLYGVSGAGVKIGVISDSVAHDPQGLINGEKSGELPPSVQVIQDGFSGSDSDEGRALLEVIHDLAPQSPLAFATGDDDPVNMASNIRRLLAAGCKVIVDDLSYEYEPMFQDGVISDAINDVVAAGATYVSAVGNDGMGGYQRTAQYVNDVSTYPNNTPHTVPFLNFAPPGQPADEYLNFTVTQVGDLIFEWDNPWDGNRGQVTADMDLFFYDSSHTQVLFSQTDNNSMEDGTGEPLEDAFAVPPGDYALRVQLTSLEPGAQPPMMYRMVLANGLDTGISNFNYPGQIGSAYGHSAGPNSISVGAVSASGDLTTSRSFSSSGPATYLFDPNGNRLATPQVIQAPVVSGVDHVTTSFFYSGSPAGNGAYYFNGTSAAAPNVAAVAALLYQYEPWATPSQIRTALEYGASPLNGAAAGTWDPQGGFGLVNAAKAVSYFDDTPPVAQLAPVLPSDGSAPYTALITFSEPVFGLTLNDLSLTLNGGSNLLTGDQTLFASADSLTYSLGNLTSLTSASGTYTLTVHADPNVTDFNGKNRLAEDASGSWNSTGPAVVARWAFYNNSFYDRTSPDASSFDDDAIAIDKAPLMPGQTASFLNYTSYTSGINGIMIDIARPPAGYVPALGDFAFKVGNNSDPTTWTDKPSPTPTSITAMAAPGLGGSERIEIIFADGSITNEWLQVTVKANNNTRLAANDVFYFGNAIGETGNSPTNAAVNSADMLAARGRQSIIESFIYNRWDFNRDGFVDNPDVLAARANPTSAATMLQLITAPAASTPSLAMSLAPATSLAASTALISPSSSTDSSTTRQAYRPDSRSAASATSSSTVTLLDSNG